MADRFQFRFDPRYQRLGRAFGVTPDRCEVVVDETELSARYGRWRVRTPLANIAEVRVTGPYLLIKTAGPARLGFTDRGLSFTSNGDRGVELRFHQRITGVDPLGVVKHPNLTLTTEDPERLADLLRTRAGLA
jgi:hypothetical protein